MKKNLFILAAAAVALASCSSDDLISENAAAKGGQPVEIGVMPFNQTVTRSAIAGTAFPQAYDMLVSTYYNPSSAGAASGSNYFEGIKFGYDGTSTKWKSRNGAKYYPLEGTLDFLAVASAGYKDASTGIAPTATWGDASNCAKKVVLTVPANNEKFDDLLYGAAYAQALSAEGTPMTFNHAMTSVVFNAKSNVAYNAETNAGITINSITVKSAKQTGTLTITNPSAGGGSGDLTAVWSSLDGAADVAARVWNTANLGNNASESALANLNLTTSYCDMTTKKFGEGYVIIPPQNAVEFDISYTIHNGFEADGSTPVNNTLTYKYIPVGTWDMGKKNVYNITFTLTEIMIEPVVVDWIVDLNNNTIVDDDVMIDIPAQSTKHGTALAITANEAGKYTVKVTDLGASAAYTVAVTDGDDIISVDPVAGSADGDGVATLTFNVKKHATSGNHSATITLTKTEGSTTTEITVNQTVAP